jgi:UDP-N-acetylmuramoyl-L-alanyl-D-glutamate--2,6-diaminopimelate ligase
MQSSINPELHYNFFTDITSDSRNVHRTSLFVCTKGVTTDRHNFIDEVIDKGVVGIVVSKKYLESKYSFKNGAPEHYFEEHEISYYVVDDVNEVADLLFSEFYDNPADNLKKFAITGTDGKTSTSTIISQLIGTDRTINIGTNGIQFNGEKVDSWNTTPDSEEFYQVVRQFNGGIPKKRPSWVPLTEEQIEEDRKQAEKPLPEALTIEFSSEAQHYGRLSSLMFDVIGLTNITSEHLNTHGTLEGYISAKTDVFLKHLKKGGVAVLNSDDEHFSDLHNAIRNSRPDVTLLTYGIKEECTLQILEFQIFIDKTIITFQYNDEKFEVESPLAGSFNVENLACALLMCLSNGYSLKKILQNVPSLKISGRLEGIDEGQDFTVIVDYAHTPNGLTRMYEFVKTAPGINRIITVIGQAGERDKVKRPTVGKIVADNSDFVVWTQEDPKHEPVADTIADIVSGLNPDQDHWKAVENRSEAIKYAIKQARTGDLVLILGKGAENFNKVGDVKKPWSDIDSARAVLLDL